MSTDPVTYRENFGFSITGSFAQNGACKNRVIVMFFAPGSDQYNDFVMLERERRFEYHTAYRVEKVIAWCDANKDAVRQDTEHYVSKVLTPASTTGKNEKVETINSYTVDFDFEKSITASPKKPFSIAPLTFTSVTKSEEFSDEIRRPQILSIDKRRFSEEYARLGLWKPAQFATQGLYLSEAPDLTKPVILFVHGITGSPTHFNKLAEHFRKTGFQTWYYNFPSGLPLASLSQDLYTDLNHVLDHTKNIRLHIVAHSMGGLVSRDYINRCAVDNDCYQILSFTSVSTPWAGHNAAKMGLKYARTAIPVWRDLAPGSDFLGQLFSQPLPSHLPHYLIFGIKQRDMLVFETNDGVVSMASMLDEKAQSQANKLIAINEDHAYILESDKLADQLEAIFLSHQPGLIP